MAFADNWTIYDWMYDRAKEHGLRECPCCSGKAVFAKLGNEHHKQICCEIRCSKCNLRRRQCLLTRFRRITYEELRDAMIKDWNTRPPIEATKDK